MHLSKRIIIASAFFIAAACAGGFYLGNQGVEVRINQAEAQQAVDAKLPVAAAKAGVDWTVTTAKISILPGGRLGLDATVLAGAFGRTVNFQAIGSGTPIYREGRFYVGEVELSDLGYIPDDDQSLPGRLFGAAAGARWGQDMEAKALEEGTSLLARYLEHNAVYELPDNLKGSLLRLVIRDVSVVEHALVVKLDPLGAIAKVLLLGFFAVSLAGGAIFVGFRHPEALLAMALFGAASG